MDDIFETIYTGIISKMKVTWMIYLKQSILELYQTNKNL